MLQLAASENMKTFKERLVDEYKRQNVKLAWLYTIRDSMNDKNFIAEISNLNKKDPNVVLVPSRMQERQTFLIDGRRYSKIMIK